MNLIDLFVLAVFAIFILAGFYRGFVSTLLSLGAFLISWIFSMVLLPLSALLLRKSESLYNMMLYYAEGSEYISDMELVRANISSVSTERLTEIVQQAELPFPMGKAILKNVAQEAFAGDGVTTLGEYFNQTIVSVFSNILLFLVVFMLIRVLLLFVIHGIDYAWGLPVLRHSDSLFGAGLGILQGMFALFLLFTLLPIGLTVLGGFEPVQALVDGSVFSSFFYRSNFLLSLMPTV